jgi:deoxyadenosine/deoxycytidine kinase
VEEWTNTAGSNVLQRYYYDPKRWAFTFQLNALHTRTLLWRNALLQQPHALHLSERSPFADRHIFGQLMRSEGNMDACEFAIYEGVSASLMEGCPLAGIVYLRCDPAVCQQRIR